jgi:hypothetical protein
MMAVYQDGQCAATSAEASINSWPSAALLDVRFAAASYA